MNLIVNISLNHCIGKDGKLAVRIPEDLARFKKLTTGNIIVMGANTFFGDLKGKPLPNRINVVLTSKAATLDYKFEFPTNLYFVDHPRKLIDTLLPQVKEDKEVFIIGGASVYKELSSCITAMYVTHTNSIIREGDTYFNVNWSEWEVERIESTDKCTFAKYVRK